MDEVGGGQGVWPTTDARVEDWPRVVRMVRGLTLQEHPGVIIRKVEEGPGQGDRQPVGRVEAEEPDAGVAALAVDVGPHVRLVEVRYPTEGWEPDWPDAFHGEWHQSDVGCSLEQVELELRGHERAHEVGADRPVQEEEFPPALAHDRSPIGLAGGAEAVDGRHHQ